jgi:glutamyl-tRNA synthetase
MTRARLRHAVNVFGAPGKKQLKKLEKAYAQLA